MPLSLSLKYFLAPPFGHFDNDGDDDDEYYYYGCLTAGRSWMDGGGWVGRRGKKKGRRQQAGKEWARNRAMEKAGNGKHFHTRQ